DQALQPLRLPGRQGARGDVAEIPQDAALPRRRRLHGVGAFRQLPPTLQAREPLAEPDWPRELPPRPANDSIVAGYYANITLHGPAQREVVPHLTQEGHLAYVAPTVKRNTVVFHEDLGAQERLAGGLSRHFHCPAL